MNGLHVLMVDDERPARLALRALLQELDCIRSIREADSIHMAMEMIREKQPDLLFLDVVMPGGSGFDITEDLPSSTHVVFVSAWQHYAVDAFDVEAIGYLLKPVEPERLQRVIERVLRLAAENSEEPGTLTLDSRLCLSVQGGARFFLVREIAWIGGADDYSNIYLLDGTSILSSTLLRDWERQLPAAFMRIHRSTIVQIDLADRLNRLAGDRFELLLRGGISKLQVSRRNAAALLKRIAHD